MADPLKNPARWSSYSYTFATGKRPIQVRLGWEWECEIEGYTPGESDLPNPIRLRLEGGELQDETYGTVFPTYFDAIAAANDAARLAIADGAWQPEAA